VRDFRFAARRVRWVFRPRGERGLRRSPHPDAKAFSFAGGLFFSFHKTPSVQPPHVPGREPVLPDDVAGELDSTHRRTCRERNRFCLMMWRASWIQRAAARAGKGTGSA